MYMCLISKKKCIHAYIPCMLHVCSSWLICVHHKHQSGRGDDERVDARACVFSAIHLTMSASRKVPFFHGPCDAPFGGVRESRRLYLPWLLYCRSQLWPFGCTSKVVSSAPDIGQIISRGHVLCTYGSLLPTGCWNISTCCYAPSKLTVPTVSQCLY